MLSSLLQGLRAAALLRVRAERVRATPAVLLALVAVALAASALAQRHWFFAQMPDFNPAGVRASLADLPFWLLAGWLLSRRAGVGALWLPVLLTAASPWISAVEALLVRAADAADLLEVPPADALWYAQWIWPACWPTLVAFAAAVRLPGVRRRALGVAAPIAVAALIELWTPREAIWVPPVPPHAPDELARTQPRGSHQGGAGALPVAPQRGADGVA